jgi:hypothetical protein
MLQSLLNGEHRDGSHKNGPGSNTFPKRRGSRIHTAIGTRGLAPRILGNFCRQSAIGIRIVVDDYLIGLS